MPFFKEVTEDRAQNGKKFDDTFKGTKMGAVRKRKWLAVSTVQVIDEFSSDERKDMDEDEEDSDDDEQGQQEAV